MGLLIGLLLLHIHIKALFMGEYNPIDAICAVLQKYPYVLRAELFGSQQRGDFSASSDFDLLVRFDRPREVELALEEKLGIPVALV